VALQAQAPGLGRWRILVVDDDLPTRLVLEAVLRDEGYDVLTAADGVEGLQYVWSWQPHLVLVDLVMPRSNGFAFAEAYRRLPDVEAPLVVMSGVAREPARIAAATGAAAGASQVSRRSAAVGISRRARSVGMLMQTPMLGVAVEELPGHQTFAARQMHAALRTPHHVLTGHGSCVVRIRFLSLVAFDEPVRDECRDQDQEKFAQSPPARFKSPLVCRNATRASSGRHSGS